MKKILKYVCLISFLITISSGPVFAEPYIGEIRMTGYHFTQKNWMPCVGQKIEISVNNALYSLLGRRYGGDGRTFFRLPDLRHTLPDGKKGWLKGKPIYQICINGIYPSRS
ncbi:MAG: tail fiber protein [Gammaproteobacteria bacterium]|nr:tail fiber protein [Gammaproteobacteria bacterium]